MRLAPVKQVESQPLVSGGEFVVLTRLEACIKLQRAQGGEMPSTSLRLAAESCYDALTRLVRSFKTSTCVEGRFSTLNSHGLKPVLRRANEVRPGCVGRAHLAQSRVDRESRRSGPLMRLSRAPDTCRNRSKGLGNAPKAA